MKQYAWIILLAGLVGLTLGGFELNRAMDARDKMITAEKKSQIYLIKADKNPKSLIGNVFADQSRRYDSQAAAYRADYGRKLTLALGWGGASLLLLVGGAIVALKRRSTPHLGGPASAGAGI